MKNNLKLFILFFLLFLPVSSCSSFSTVSDEISGVSFYGHFSMSLSEKRIISIAKIRDSEFADEIFRSDRIEVIKLGGDEDGVFEPSVDVKTPDCLWIVCGKPFAGTIEIINITLECISGTRRVLIDMTINVAITYNPDPIVAFLDPYHSFMMLWALR